MALLRKLLNHDESVLVSTRTHAKAMLGPAVFLILIAGLAGFLSALPTGTTRTVLQWVIWAGALVLIALLVVRPFLAWLTVSYTVTDRSLITRSGILNRRVHDIPLARIGDVSYERGILDRMLGCGTLVVSDGSEHGRVELHDVPQVELLHLQISELLFDSRRAAADSRNLSVDDGT